MTASDQRDSSYDRQVSGRQSAHNSQIQDVENRIADASGSENATEVQWDNKWKERLRDIATFDALIKANPEILSKLAAQGVDLSAEKQREREQLMRSDPSMTNEEASARSELAVYLRHQETILRLIPDTSKRKELDAGFDKLKSIAREVGIPYQESIRTARDISSGDKSSILAATTITSPDIKSARKGSELHFESSSDPIRQVWTIRTGEPPEKAIELPNGPRIKIASAPQRDAKLIQLRDRAVDEIAVLTAWN